MFLALVMGVIIVGCANDPGIATRTSGVKEAGSGMGVLIGKVTKGPMSPVEKSGSFHAPAPVPGARIVISGLNVQGIKSVVTDDQGAYSTSLPPGTYRIDMAPLIGTGWFTKDLPANVIITEGQETHLDIHVDTRIR